jgi:hypothetical protein
MTLMCETKDRYLFKKDGGLFEKDGDVLSITKSLFRRNIFR